MCAISDGEAPECDRGLLRLMAELLFMENSRPVQRQLLSGLHRMPPGRFRAFMGCISLQVCPVHACNSPPYIFECTYAPLSKTLTAGIPEGMMMISLMLCRDKHFTLQIKEAAEEYEAARLSRMSLTSEASQAPRAVLADVMFSLLEFKPLQQHLRWVHHALFSSKRPEHAGHVTIV